MTEKLEHPDYSRLKHLAGIFHSHATALASISSILRPAIVALGPNPFPGDAQPTAEQVVEIVTPAAIQLRDSLTQLAESFPANWQERNIPKEILDKGLELQDQFQQFITRLDKDKSAFIPHALRIFARTILDYLPSLRSKLAREKIKDTERKAREVERIVCLYDLRHALSQIIDLEYELHDLRDDIAAVVQPEDTCRNLIVWSLVNEEVTSLKKFASLRNVEIRSKVSREAQSAKARVAERDLRRAFRSIIHNAIKYSGQLRGGAPAWVDVRCRKETSVLVVEIESWGAPITRRELEEGLVFRFGYRGQFASARGQTGTGIGLADARQVFRSHGGDINIHSRPDRAVSEGREFDAPHVTTVEVNLPLHPLTRMEAYSEEK